MSAPPDFLGVGDSEVLLALLLDPFGDHSYLLDRYKPTTTETPMSNDNMTRDQLAVSATEEDILAHRNLGILHYGKSREQARYAYADAMIKAREDGLKQDVDASHAEPSRTTNHPKQAKCAEVAKCAQAAPEDRRFHALAVMIRSVADHMGKTCASNAERAYMEAMLGKGRDD